MNTPLEVALKFVETFKGCQYFTYKGETYPCSIGDETAVANLQWGGFSQNIEKVFSVRKSVLVEGIYPQDNDTLTIDGALYIVIKVVADSTDTFLQIGVRKK